MTSQYAYRQRLQYLLFMLRHKKAGNASTLAIKLNCCSRTVKNCIAKLRKDGFVIKYDQGLKRYVLTEE
jgi:predicted transcriptional regulator